MAKTNEQTGRQINKNTCRIDQKNEQKVQKRTVKAKLRTDIL